MREGSGCKTGPGPFSCSDAPKGLRRTYAQEGHLLAGTYVQEIRKWRSATSYMERYVAKPEQFPEGVETGRVWGVWNEELLPVQWETVKVSLKDAYRIRRIYRRMAKMRGRGHLHRLTVFVRHDNVVRLLEFLGYRLDE